MPQYVQYGDHGLIEFPDEMSRAEIESTLKDHEDALNERVGKGRVASAASSFARSATEAIGQTESAVGRIAAYQVPGNIRSLAMQAAMSDDEESAQSLLATAKAAEQPAAKEQLVRENPIYQQGRELTEAARDVYQPNPAYAREFLAGKLPSGVGTTLPVVALGAVAGPLAAAGQYGLSLGEAGAEEAEDFGRPDAADKAFLYNAGVGALSEFALGVPANILKYVRAARGAGVAPEVAGRIIQTEIGKRAVALADQHPVIAQAVKAGLHGTAQQSLQTIGQNIIASDLAGYDPNRRLAQGVAEAGGTGGAIGLLFGGAGAAVGRYGRPRGPEASPQAAPEAAPRPEALPGYPMELPDLTAADVADLHAPVERIAPEPLIAPAPVEESLTESEVASIRRQLTEEVPAAQPIEAPTSTAAEIEAVAPRTAAALEQTTRKEGQHAVQELRPGILPETQPAVGVSAVGEEMRKGEERPEVGRPGEVGAEPTKVTPEAPPPAPAGYGSKNKIVSSERAEELAAKLRAKFGQLGVGVDPEILAIGAELAAYHVEAGARKFADFSKAMITHAGEAIRPYLKALYAAARNWPGLDAAGMETEEAIRKAETEPAEAETESGAPPTPPVSESSLAPTPLPEPGQSATVGHEQPIPERPGRGKTGDIGPGTKGTVPGGPSDIGTVGVGGAEAGQAVGEGGQPVPGIEGAAGPGIGGAGVGAAGGTEQPPGGPRDIAVIRSGPPANYVIRDEDKIGVGSLKTKFADNIEAIKALKRIRAENRPATPEEQALLVKYVGWGGMKSVFDSKSRQWAREHLALRALLTEDEWTHARASVLNAHYTSKPVIDAIYAILQRMGFRGGRILEPGLGIGHFYGLMPPEMRGRSSYLGIEKDALTGEIAKLLYPSIEVIAPKGYQEVVVPPESFDAAIGNPPFGSEKVYDASHPDFKFSLHNFFFAKSIDKLRPGGVLGMVVSNFFLDGTKNAEAREWIHQRANFLGAIRLPNTAFKENANTEVTTDIVFLQKRLPGQEPPTEAPWLKAGKIPDPEGGDPIPLNQYFIDHPDMMLGEMRRVGKMEAANQPALVPLAGEKLENALSGIEVDFPANIYTDPGKAFEPKTDLSEMVPAGVKVGGLFVMPDGRIAQRTSDVLAKRQATVIEFPNAKAQERAAGMVKVRDALNDLVRAELSDTATDEDLAAKRAKLNSEYDAFQKEHGFINALGNRRAFQADPDMAKLESLEPEYDPGISKAVAKKRGVPERAPSAGKATILTKRVNAPYREVTSANTAKEALVVSLNQRGNVDLDYMAKLSGKDRESIIADLKGLVFQVPEGGWQQREKYLSGDVKLKLKQAEAAALKDAAYQENVEALTKVLPADIPPGNIKFRLGSPWIDPRYISDFTFDMIGERPDSVHYEPSIGRWLVDLESGSVEATQQWGTDRMSFPSILRALLGQKLIQVRDNVGTASEPNWVVNEPASAAAQAKAEQVTQAFQDWLFKDATRAGTLTAKYNALYNTHVAPSYDGSHLSLPGTNPDIEFRQHQKNAVWRMIQDRIALLDHVVGAGKTYAGVAGMMEMRRLGLVRKPMFVVPNHLVIQWRDEFNKLYPNANILATREADFAQGNRRKLFGRISTSDWDAVIVGHSSFKKIGMPTDKQHEILSEQVDDITEAIGNLKKAKGDQFTIRKLEQARARLMARFDRLAASVGKKDTGSGFDELGVDGLFVDEAQEFKNLFYYTQMSNVAGLGTPEGSGRAFDLFVKTRWLQDTFGGKGVTAFATGTPISNSLVEAFTVQRYLQYPLLKQKGLAHLDAWAGVFGNVGQVYEVDPTGTGYRMATRFSHLVNLPELKGLYGQVTDSVTMDDLKAQAEAEGKRFPVPKLKGGKPTIHVEDRSPQQERYFGVEQPVLDATGNQIVKPDGSLAVEYNPGSILWRIENMPDDPRVDNMLKITNDARKAGLDYRLIDPNAPDHPNSKVNRAVDEIQRIHKQWNEDKGTQLVFIDLSVPKSAKGKATARARDLAAHAETAEAEPAVGEEATPEETAQPGVSADDLLADQSAFSVYDDMKAKLIKAGVPAHQVAFIHDYDTAAKKQEMFKAMRRGDIRVLLGSTMKMGAGMNVQDRLVALHHIDAPWRPSDVEQREGRILRQGNKFYNRDPDGFEVEIHRYATRQTYDTRMWQLIEHKATGIEAFRNADMNVRELEDVHGEAANAADMKAAASGNPLIQEEIRLRVERRKLEALRVAWENNRFKLNQDIKELSGADQRFNSEQTHWEKVIERRNANTPEEFSYKMGEQTLTDKKKVGEAVASVILQSLKNKTSYALGQYRGMGLFVEPIGDRAYVKINPVGLAHETFGLENVTDYKLSDVADGAVGTGYSQRLDNWINDQPESRIRWAESRLGYEKQRLAGLIPEAAKPFAQQQQLDDVRKNHDAIIADLRANRRPLAATPAAVPGAAPETRPPPDRIEDWLTRAISALEWEGGITYADPFLIQAIGRPALRSLLQVTRAVYRATKDIAASVRAGMDWLKENYADKQFDEAKVRTAIEQDLNQAPAPTASGQSAPEGPRPPGLTMDGQRKLSEALAWIRDPDSDFYYRKETHEGREDAARRMLSAFGSDIESAQRWALNAPDFSGMTDSLKITFHSLLADEAADRRFNSPNMVDALKWKGVQDRSAQTARAVGSAQGQGLETMRQAAEIFGRGAAVEQYQEMLRKKAEAALAGKYPEVISNKIKAWLDQSARQAVDKMKVAMSKADTVVSRALKRAQEDYGPAWRQIMMDSADAQGDHRREIYRRVLEHPMLQGLSQADALEVTNLLNRAWVKEWQNVFRSEFRKQVQLPSVEDANKVIATTPELVKQANLGLLTNETMRSAIAQKYGAKAFSEEAARRIYQAAQEAQAKPEGAQRATAMRRVINIAKHEGGLTKLEMLSSYWYSSVLSSFGTQGRNIIGNTSLMASNFLSFNVRQPDAAPQLFSALLRGFMQNAQGEFQAIMRGAEASRLAADIRASGNALEVMAMSQNRWVRLLSNFKYVTRFMLAVDSFFYDANAEVMATFDAFREGKEANLSRQEINDHIAERLQLRPEEIQQAEGQARAEIAAGLTDGKDFQRRRNEILRQARPADIQQNMARFGLEATLNNEPDGFMGVLYKGVIKLRKEQPLFTAVVPFARISANVTNMLLDHSPIGLLKVLATRPNAPVGFLHKAFASEKLTAEQWQQLRAKVVLSHALAISALLAAVRYKDDKDPAFAITGTWDLLSPQQRRQLMDQGLRPYQVRIAGVGINYLQTPAALFFAGIGNYLDGVRYSKLGTKDAEVQLATALAAGRNVIIDQQFLSGLAAFFDRPNFNANGADMLQRMSQMAARTVTGLVPTATKELDSMVRPEVKQAKGFWDYIQRDIPVARWSMANQVNVLGDKIERPRYPWTWLVQGGPDDPVWQALADKAAAGVFVPAESASAQILENGKRVKMTDAQFLAYQTEAGRLYRDKLTRDLERFKALTPDQSKEYFKKDFEKLREVARDRVRQGRVQ